MLHRELQTLATAIMFLTRIPVGSHASASPQVLARSTLYFPIVGLVVGLLTAVSFLLANAIWPTIIATAIALLFSIALTGAFHEDGLADVADSLGAWTKERKLEVMRDSRIGTYGAVALILVILLKYITLFTIFNSTFTDTDNAVITSPALVLATFSLAHVLGRWSSLPIIRFTNYAREESTNKIFTDGLTTRRMVLGTIPVLTIGAVCFWSLGVAVLISFVAALLVVFLTRWRYLKSINGITGDCLGATNKLTELAVYLTIAGTLVK